MESEGVDTGPVGSFRERALVHFRTQRITYDIKVLTTLISGMLHPYSTDRGNLQKAIDNLLEFVEGGGSIFKEDKLSKQAQEIQGAMDLMDQMIFMRDKRQNGD